MKKISLIAAMTPSGVIGLDNTLPWKLPEDLKLFKKTTTGNIIVMGRKTFESIGKPLPGRKNFVITSRALAPAEMEQKGDGPYYFSSLDEALSAAEKTEGEPFIIGGSSVYRQAIAFADVLYLSMINKEYSGNIYFPVFDRDDWELCEEKDYGDFVLNVLRRKKPVVSDAL